MVFNVKTYKETQYHIPCNYMITMNRYNLYIKVNCGICCFYLKTNQMTCCFSLSGATVGGQRCWICSNVPSSITVQIALQDADRELCLLWCSEEMQYERADNGITREIALNYLLMWNGAYCLEARAYMFMCFDLSICFRHYLHST